MSQIVPVFDDLSVFEAADVKANLGAEEIVVGVGKNKLAVTNLVYQVATAQPTAHLPDLAALGVAFPSARD